MDILYPITNYREMQLPLKTCQVHKDVPSILIPIGNGKISKSAIASAYLQAIIKQRFHLEAIVLNFKLRRSI